MINIQTQPFESDLRDIAQAMMQAGVDRDLGNPRGANVKVDDDLGVITIVWTGRGKTFTVDRFVPPSQWHAAKVEGKANGYIKKCITEMQGQLRVLKARNL